MTITPEGREKCTQNESLLRYERFIPACLYLFHDGLRYNLSNTFVVIIPQDKFLSELLPSVHTFGAMGFNNNTCTKTKYEIRRCIQSAILLNSISPYDLRVRVTPVLSLLKDDFDFAKFIERENEKAYRELLGVMMTTEVNEGDDLLSAYNKSL